MVRLGNGWLEPTAAAREALIADLETTIGAVEVVPESVGINAAVPLFALVILAPEIVMYR